jgi:SAM-dependent methyltransferase
MHDSALTYGRLFFETYSPTTGAKVVDIGAVDVNGSLRSVAPQGIDYIGLDFAPGKGVDILIEDPYSLPLPDESADVIVSSSCFEHSEFFWLLFLDAIRILKPSGLLYINVPSNGVFHRYPVDCWRFYPDSGRALQNWGRRNGVDCLMLESFTGPQQGSGWNDFVAVFVKDRQCAHHYQKRMIHNAGMTYNGYVDDNQEIRNLTTIPDDHKGYGKLKILKGLLNEVLDQDVSSWKLKAK